ncbi:MAG: translation elongation factor 4 [Patescibacteria group bacterium]
MNIRNFCIIAHIDHGKSTLADRLIEHTATVSKREMKDQLLDQMDLERERGITIKLQPVRMEYNNTILNLIDTPGHVDFSYEVSRSLTAVEGAILLVDATQGVQAQTIANVYLALEQNLTIIPVLNKIDLASARIEDAAAEVQSLIGCSRDDILSVSAKTGEGVPELINAIINRIPPPTQSDTSPTRALIFDSVYDEFRGVVAYVRVVDGVIPREQNIRFMASGSSGKVLECGYFRPQYVSSDSLLVGEIGYIVTGLKDVRQCRVGDTIVQSNNTASLPLPGYKEVKPMVFAGIFCKIGDEFKRLRDAVEKLRLNDAAFTFEPEHSPALGFGFRCGFLGMLHLEIVQERLRREYQLDIIITVPSVAYRVFSKNNQEIIIHSPLELEDESAIERIEEPWTLVDILSQESTIGPLISLVMEKQGVYKNTEYLLTEMKSGDRRVILHFELPLSAILVDFYDSIKSISSGYASMNYELCGYREADVVKLDIRVSDEIVEELTSLVYRNQAYHVGRKIVESLKKVIERQQFEVKIQAAIGSKVIASERIAPYRKDVTAKLYGGDVTRKQKLLEKQKKGKKRMKQGGHVELPPEAYLSVLRK